MFLNTLNVVYIIKTFSSSNLFWFCYIYLIFQTVFQLYIIFKFQWICFEFKQIHMKRTSFVKIKIITATHPIDIISIFANTLNVTYFRKKISSSNLNWFVDFSFISKFHSNYIIFIEFPSNSSLTGTHQNFIMVPTVGEPQYTFYL